MSDHDFRKLSKNLFSARSRIFLNNYSQTVAPPNWQACWPPASSLLSAHLAMLNYLFRSCALQDTPATVEFNLNLEVNLSAPRRRG